MHCKLNFMFQPFLPPSPLPTYMQGISKLAKEGTRDVLLKVARVHHEVEQLAATGQLQGEDDGRDLRERGREGGREEGCG